MQGSPGRKVLAITELLGLFAVSEEDRSLIQVGGGVRGEKGEKSVKDYWGSLDMKRGRRLSSNQSSV